MDIQTKADVEQCLVYYSYRWLIERFHYILKSGCKLEELQLETAERLEKASTTYNILAMRILELTYLSRIQPEIGAETIFSGDQISILKMKYVKKGEKKKLLLIDAMIMVAMLGGFMGRKSDGMPGVKTIWRGMFALEMMVEGLKYARKSIEELSFHNSSIDST